jgi:hypothetical protein
MFKIPDEDMTGAIDIVVVTVDGADITVAVTIEQDENEDYTQVSLFAIRMGDAWWQSCDFGPVEARLQEAAQKQFDSQEVLA